MSRRWEKLGLVYRPDPKVWWRRTHASLPTALHLFGSMYRVFFAGRDANHHSHIGSFDIDLLRPTEPVNVPDEPILAPGPVGNFDWQGVYPASIVREDASLYMYTIGWTTGSPAPLFYASIGLAISDDDGRTFRKHGPSPILGRSPHDPCLVTSPFVLHERGRWRMWYVSGVAWDMVDGVPNSRYHIKYAESADGLAWHRDGVVAVAERAPSERNVSRLCVVKGGGGYDAWFAADSGDGYRINHASSADGMAWVRHGEPLGLEPSVGGFDSEALAYPFVVRHEGTDFMFYNGNGYGRDGIALAIRAE